MTITPYLVVYSYAAFTLWLAYGIAIGLTLLGVISGMVSVGRNGGSYTTKFSTILRVAHCILLSGPVPPGDAGRDPASPYVENLSVSFPGKDAVNHDSQDYSLGEMGNSSAQKIDPLMGPETEA